MNNKVRYVSAVIIAVLISIISVLFGNVLFGEYFSYNDTINFSWFSSVTYMVPVVFSFPIIYFSTAFLRDETTASIICSKYLKVYKYLLVFCLLVLIAFPIGYVLLLKEKGYISCDGIPTGYMPGMGKEYVTDISLCDR